MAISIKVNGLNKVSKRFNEMKKRSENPNTISKVIAVKAWKEVLSHFKKELGKKGKWQPFKIGGRWTGKGQNRKFDSGAKLLQNTGRYRNSTLWKTGKNDIVVYNNTKYGKYHEFGKGRMKRDIMWLPKNKIKEFIKTFEKYLAGK